MKLYAARPTSQTRCQACYDERAKLVRIISYLAPRYNRAVAAGTATMDMAYLLTMRQKDLARWQQERTGKEQA